MKRIDIQLFCSNLIKTFMMKKITLFRVMMLVMTLFSASAAFAGDGKYYWFKTEAVAYAPGNGQVFVGKSSEEPVYQDTCRAQSSSTLNAFGYYYWAQPAEEFNFVGWSEDMETLVSIDNPAYMAFESPTEGTADENTPNWPEEPKRLYGCFGYIRVEVGKGYEDLGSVSIYPLCNEARETVTLSATPEEGCEFDYWENGAGERFYEQDLEFKVSEPDVYKAYFKTPGMYNVRFDNEDMIAFSHRGTCDLNNIPVVAYYFNNRMIINDKLVLANPLAYGVNETRGYLLAAEEPGTYPVVFKDYTESKAYNDLFTVTEGEDTEEGEVTEGEEGGEGEEGEGEEEKEPFINLGKNDFNILIPTLDKDFWLDELPDSCKYYTFDGKQFNLVVAEEGASFQFPQNSAFLMIPESMGTGSVITPAKGRADMIFNPDNAFDYYYEYHLDEEEGGETDAITTAPVVRKAKGIAYDLQGRRLAAPRRGVNIVGGKKVVL